MPARRQRGRRPTVLSSDQRLQIVQVLKRHPSRGVRHLRREIPGLPRNAAAAFVRALKAAVARSRRQSWQRLVWHVPGAVWAIDGTWMDQPVDGRSRRALIVVDVHSHRVLALQPVPGERASAVLTLLHRLIEEHGAPLVLKADNGSAFTAAAVAQLCRSHGITRMHSPVRRPRWNGTCEVCGRWAKARATAAAAQRGSVTLSRCDLDAAVTVAGRLPAVPEALRRRFRAIYEHQVLRVAAERGLAFNASLPDHVRRSLERVAAQRALLECHILTIKGRGFPQCLPAECA